MGDSQADGRASYRHGFQEISVPESATRNVHLKRVLGPPPPESALALIATARNERYFWPHFLQHYRRYGVEHFIVLDDNSNDGSLDWLRQQSDVSVFVSALSFADTVGKLRFGIAARGLMARHFCAGRWALIADLDEFWLPPPQFTSFSQLTTSLDAQSHILCRGIMLDCFPETLSTLDHQAVNTPPNIVAPFTDVLSPLNWPANLATAALNSRHNVRNRMSATLHNRGLMSREDLRQRGDPTLYKAPLARWVEGVAQLSAHRLQAPYHDQHQMICGHYKFYPGWQEKVRGALATGSYYNSSIEYRMLDLAQQHMANDSLKGARSVAFKTLSQSPVWTF